MKKFAVHHSLSANKVGVDGVLIGAWASLPDSLISSEISSAIPSEISSAMILDAGCGCGLIAMMMHQRFPQSRIWGIDIDAGAIQESQLNVNENGMADRISILNKNFADLSWPEMPNENLPSEILPNESLPAAGFDLIVSNPPFFNSGVKVSEGDSSRVIARHASALSPQTLIKNAGNLLNPSGLLAFIAHAADEYELLDLASHNGLRVRRICRVKGNPNVVPKRIMLEFEKSIEGQGKHESHIDESMRRELRGDESKVNGLLGNKSHIFKGNRAIYQGDMEVEELTIEFSPGDYTPEYITLCKDFYLKF